MPAAPHCTAQIVRSSSGPNRGLNQGRIESPMPFLRTQVFCCFAVQWPGGTGRFHRLYGLGEGVSRAPGEQPFLELSAVDSLSSLRADLAPGPLGLAIPIPRQVVTSLAIRIRVFATSSGVISPRSGSWGKPKRQISPCLTWRIWHFPTHPTAGTRGRKAYPFFRPFTCCLSLLLISSLVCSTCS